MPRWEPQAAQRLEEAALDLFETAGYEATTVGDIAARAGVTARTYFRYFPDKKEVLFGGSGRLVDRIVGGVRDAAPDSPPLATALAAMAACGDLHRARGRLFLRRRAEVVERAAELREREAHKLASIAAAVATELVARGEDVDGARLAADVAVAVFADAARRWTADPSVGFEEVLARAGERARALR